MKINRELLDDVSLKAKQSERLRMNYNFHESYDSGAQRILNALEVGTNLPIHRHKHTNETYIVLRGAIEVRFYDYPKNDNSDNSNSDNSNSTVGSYNLEVVDSFVLDPLLEEYGVDIPKGVWHDLIVLKHDTVIFEVKDGPYDVTLTEQYISES